MKAGPRDASGFRLRQGSPAGGRNRQRAESGDPAGRCQCRASFAWLSKRFGWSSDATAIGTLAGRQPARAEIAARIAGSGSRGCQPVVNRVAARVGCRCAERPGRRVAREAEVGAVATVLIVEDEEHLAETLLPCVNSIDGIIG